MVDRLILARAGAEGALGGATEARRLATAEATAAKARPPEKLCIVCGEVFRRVYADIHGKPRLRSLREWPRSIYCSRSCASAYRGRKAKGWRMKLPLHLASLEPER